jgi:hypothetical protein
VALLEGRAGAEVRILAKRSRRACPPLSINPQVIDFKRLSVARLGHLSLNPVFGLAPPLGEGKS